MSRRTWRSVMMDFDLSHTREGGKKKKRKIFSLLPEAWKVTEKRPEFLSISSDNNKTIYYEDTVTCTRRTLHSSSLRVSFTFSSLLHHMVHSLNTFLSKDSSATKTNKNLRGARLDGGSTRCSYVFSLDPLRLD